MKRVVLCCLCGAWVLVSCQGIGKEKGQTRESVLAQDSTFFEPTEFVLTGEDDREPPVTMDELFDDFFFNFAGNERMQRSRISFPLHLNAFGSDMVVERDEWQYKDFFHDNEFYTVFFNSEADMDFEGIDRMAIDVQLINPIDSTLQTFHFDRQDGQWKLTRETMGELMDMPLHDFFLFYQSFATDSVFQRQSVARPLRFVTSDVEDEEGCIEGTLTPDQWFVFRPDLPQGVLTNIIYGQTYSNPNHMIMLKRGIANGMLDIFTFVRRDGDWKLTQYEN